MKTGRPSDYSQEALDTALAYVETFKEQYGHAIPSVMGLGKILKRPEKTLYAWGHANPDFRKALDMINNNQKFELVNSGLLNEFNSNIAKLALGNHGMSERHQDMTGKNWNDEENKWEVEITHTKDVDAGKE